MKHKVYVVMEEFIDDADFTLGPEINSIWFLGRLAQERLQSLETGEYGDIYNFWIEEHYVS